MFDRICASLSLGELTAPPVQLHGGYTHRMFRLDTDRGRYAVKLLNPEIMQRPDALDNYRTAEGFEALLEAKKLPILPALTIGGRKMQQVDGQYLYVFDFYDGRMLPDADITPAHCAKSGAVLARIHNAAPPRKGEPLSLPEADSSPAKGRLTPQSPVGDSSPAKRSPTPQSPGGDSSPTKGSLFALAESLLASDDAKTEGAALRTAAPMLEQATAAMQEALRRLPRVEALCHNDMDPKNVLWQGEDFRIIDLECLGYADPRQELLDLAISWAGWPPDEAKFKAFVSAYAAAGGLRMTDAALVYDSRRNHIDWLAYNARRALFDAPAERRIGREQVVETLGKIESDQRNREKILRWMGELWAEKRRPT